MYYTEYRKLARTGDAVFFSGEGALSEGIKCATFSEWSHVGLVVRTTDPDMVLLWESTTLSNLVDIDTGKKFQGVQVVPLSLRLATYDGAVAVRRSCAAFHPAVDRIISELRREYAGRPYERSTWQLVKAAYDGPFGQNKEDTSSLFCSELVAEAWKRVQWLDTEAPSNEFTPADLAKMDVRWLLSVEPLDVE